MTEPVYEQASGLSTLIATPQPEPLAHSAPSVPCMHCRAPIPAETFSYGIAAERLLSAPCPDCHRRTVLATATWLRWSAQPDCVTP